MTPQLSLSLFGVLTLTAVGCGSDQVVRPDEESPEPEPVAQEIVTWLQHNSVSFASAEPAGSLDGLLPLREMIGDARVVALGEATHGTREFFLMKDRVLRLMVSEMGFNIFAIEASWPEANRLNDYVHTGLGDPAVLLSGLYFWTWNTQEVLDMIEWMREHNANPGAAPTVSFFGFDMQFPGMAVYNVEAYVEGVDPTFTDFVEGRYDCFRPYLNGPSGQRSLQYRDASTSIQQQCSQQVQEVYDSLAARRSLYETLSTAEEYALALQSARIVAQNEEMDRTQGSFVRDRAMAENAVWLLEQGGPDAKIVHWAHNGHVSDRSGWMGSHLREEYGDDLVIVGFDFYRGSFSAVTQSASGSFTGLTTHSVGPPPDGSYEYYFHAAAIPRLILDLRDVDFSLAATSWLAGPRRMRSIGCCFRPSNELAHFYDAYLPEEFDLSIYFDDTSASVLLPFQPPTVW
jgi:erythromycin esterase